MLHRQQKVGSIGFDAAEPAHAVDRLQCRALSNLALVSRFWGEYTCRQSGLARNGVGRKTAADARAVTFSTACKIVRTIFTLFLSSTPGHSYLIESVRKLSDCNLKRLTTPEGWIR